MFNLKSEVDNIFVGGILGMGIIIFSLLRLDGEKQIKLARFLLIISTLLTAMIYIIFKSES